MSELFGVLKSNAGRIILKDPSATSKDVKAYIDSVINTCKNGSITKKAELDEITVDGLDANQVWWQVKLVLDSIDGDLIQGIQELKDVVTPSHNLSDGSTLNSSSGEESELEEAESVFKEKQMLSADVSEIEEQSNDSLSENDEEPSMDDEKTSAEAAREEFAEEKRISSGQDERHSSPDPYGINDKFFDLEKFNRDTLAAEDSNEASEGSEDEDIDYFQDMPSDDEEEEAIYYEDFFDKPTKEPVKKHSDVKDPKEDEELDEKEHDSAMDKVKLDLFADEEDEPNAEGVGEASDKNLSSFEKQQIEIRKQIEQLENEAVAEKKWSLKGEVKAKDRPEDALLTEELEFDRTAKPVPVITSEVTESLEDMIRRRIQDSNFDDLQRRTLLDITRKSQRPQFELSDVKSSKSLAEIYEDDYTRAEDESALSEELQKAHSEISELYANLVYKLDVLSSVHFVPKPASTSLEIRVETPTISMEDAQPLYMSNASSLAPQEIYNVGKAEKDGEIRLKNGVAMSKEELTREDKNRLRRALKRKRSKANLPNVNKRSKRNDVVDTLSKAKNITVINQKGEKKDVSGKTKKSRSGPDSTNIKL
ncbi:U3 snoRNP protein [Saccharomyces cerevisiae]|jgi:U3 small nucleolar RNA-associated protein MPP10|uniref:U3 small nucleolar ribonucleoprotein protein MPP10 n=1 Tax=Saccharomyces cerevisiae (strain Kyokai no. 7 / NBRC 101557) TaxID=721032 RepID=G2WH11_YEASK|nr:Mpp10p [Saccharomyces cerevisiae YJM1450]AJR72134.1 Mpp10p [Saccharomyces cerevisiae YJM1460]AJR75406.1 Mpp10p [Saccharomyces cerevisiae YJM1592]AJV39402.1 Mpp10p [Saccharomyces cerevisiae YJM1307]AJV39732.1 Mpp10p [Saccharomyces cerevisiae YJM1311]AJV43317.1 Mpp10p [Saccharomyces cerevisiae YJM1385]AJV44296.1 Mpp10p [Saccharomyces cerevisiae YJM1388]AJV44626.1 Mpp10p [Saccharomyces cerevisiae YJM1389]KAF4003877.1 U3 small nucleolar RNA-associated protein MPP10 [Saccharomyces cerevisiae]